MNIGDRIKERRVSLGYTVEELAEKLGKNRATIYRYEKNEIENLPTTVLEPLAEVLQTTPAHLMGWLDEDEEVKQIEEHELVYLARKGDIEFTEEEKQEIIDFIEFKFNKKNKE